MFVIGTCLLLLGHFSSEPNCRHAFNSSGKNTCARGLNIFVSILSLVLNLTTKSSWSCVNIIGSIRCSYKYVQLIVS